MCWYLISYANYCCLPDHAGFPFLHIWSICCWTRQACLSEDQNKLHNFSSSLEKRLCVSADGFTKRTRRASGEQRSLHVLRANTRLFAWQSSVNCKLNRSADIMNELLRKLFLSPPSCFALVSVSSFSVIHLRINYSTLNLILLFSSGLFWWGDGFGLTVKWKI